MELKDLFWHGLDTEDKFFGRIDVCGGWPLGAKFVIVQHTVENNRPCWFSDEPVRNEMNTVRNSADDYYWWKLSDERKAEHRKQSRQEFSEEIRGRV